MKWLVHTTARLLTAAAQAYTHRWSFVFVSALIFVASVAGLARLDLLPEAKKAVLPVTRESATTELPAMQTAILVEEPLKIEIPRISVSTTVSNPTSTDIALLDRALLAGAVRYPTSAKLGETGNVVLFGHSSYLPVVGNKAYKAFNDIQKLKAGDVITVYAATTAYTYRVRTVDKENAATDGIPLAVSGRVLTLSTCDSFGAKTDRYVVTADFVDSHSILL